MQFYPNSIKNQKLLIHVIIKTQETQNVSQLKIAIINITYIQFSFKIHL